MIKVELLNTSFTVIFTNIGKSEFLFFHKT